MAELGEVSGEDDDEMAELAKAAKDLGKGYLIYLFSRKPWLVWRCYDARDARDDKERNKESSGND